MSDDLKIGIVGAGGRMGQMLVRQVTATEGCRVAGATEHDGNPLLGQDVGAVAGVGELGVSIVDDPAAMIANVDAVIDFTIPAATAEHARLAAQAEALMIAGTTGLDAEQENAITLAARHVPVVRASNFSVGVTLLMALTEQVARILGPEAYDIEILEMHHKHKIDAPSTLPPSGRRFATGIRARDRKGRSGLPRFVAAMWPETIRSFSRAKASGSNWGTRHPAGKSLPPARCGPRFGRGASRRVSTR
jgi:4-hydroxy-tetrahydrodipicolinate reductase